MACPGTVLGVNGKMVIIQRGLHTTQSYVTQNQTLTTNEEKSNEAKRNSSVSEGGHSASEDEDMGLTEQQLPLDRDISEPKQGNKQCDNELDKDEPLEREIAAIKVSSKQLPAVGKEAAFKNADGSDVTAKIIGRAGKATG